MRFWAECGDFFRETRRHFRTTGSLVPSSRFLARALVTELRPPRGPSRILEVGPGTGSVTAQILRYLRPDDQLDAVKINGHFVSVLADRFQREWNFWRCRALVRQIFRTFNRLLKPGGTLSYYEYLLIRQLQSPFVNRRERRRLYCVGRVVGDYIRTYQVRRQQVLMNMPPAIVRHLRLKPTG